MEICIKHKRSGLEELSLMFYIALLSLWGANAFRACPAFGVKLPISPGRGCAQWQGEQNKAAEGLSRVLRVIEQNSCRCPSRQSSDNKENSGRPGGDVARWVDPINEEAWCYPSETPVRFCTSACSKTREVSLPAQSHWDLDFEVLLQERNEVTSLPRT